jgi:hypothetical protein
MARITRALWMKEFERLTRTITVVIAAGPLIMGIARGKIETSSSWRRSCSSSGVDLARERGDKDEDLPGNLKRTDGHPQ